MAWESLLYFIPLIFFIFQSLVLAILKENVKSSIIIGALVIPFATAFYFLNLSIKLFVCFILLSFIFGFLAIFSFAVERDKLGSFFTFFNVGIIIGEYLLLLGFIPIP